MKPDTVRRKELLYIWSRLSEQVTRDMYGHRPATTDVMTIP